MFGYNPDILKLKQRMAVLEELINKLDYHARWAFSFESLFLKFGQHSWQLTVSGNPSAFNCSRCGALIIFTGPFCYTYDTSSDDPCKEAS